MIFVFFYKHFVTHDSNYTSLLSKTASRHNCSSSSAVILPQLAANIYQPPID